MLVILKSTSSNPPDTIAAWQYILAIATLIFGSFMLALIASIVTGKPRGQPKEAPIEYIAIFSATSAFNWILLLLTGFGSAVVTLAMTIVATWISVILFARFNRPVKHRVR